MNIVDKMIKSKYSFTIGMHGLIAVRVWRLSFNNLIFLIVLQLLLPTGNHIRHHSINKRQALNGPF